MLMSDLIFLKQLGHLLSNHIPGHLETETTFNSFEDFGFSVS